MNSVESNILGVVAFFVLALSSLVGYGYYVSWDVARWDKKIDALCAANGGADVATRVYETAVAPETKEYFRGSAPITTIGVVERPSGVTFGPEYPFVIETRVIQVLNEREPSVVKYAARLVRASDNRTLAERFGYQRSGGGIPLWDPGEIRKCPEVREQDRLEVKVFTNHPRYKKLEGK